MNIELTAKVSWNGVKKWYYYEWGKGAGDRKAASIYTYPKPRNTVQRSHLQEALALLEETKNSQMVIDAQSSLRAKRPTHFTASLISDSPR